MRGSVLQALLLSALAAAAFLGAGLLPGRALLPFPPENVAPLGGDATMAPAELLRGNPSGGDKLNQSLTWDRISHDRLRRGELPGWTRDIGGGAAFVPQMGQPYQPWTWMLALVDDPTTLYGVWFLLHQVLLGVLAWDFLRRLGLQHGACLIGATVLVIGLWTQARIHHNVILSAAVPIVGGLSCVHALVARRAGPAVQALLALCIGLSWSGGFAPVSLQGSYLLAAFALTLAAAEPRGQRLRALLRPLPAVLVGALLACPQMLPVLQAAADTSRAAPTDADMARDSLDAAHLLTLVWPDLLFWPRTEYYRGGFADTRPAIAALALLEQQPANRGNWFETAFAVGLAPLALAAMAFDGRRTRRAALLFAAVLAVALGLACAAPGFLTLSHVLPGARTGDVRRFLFLVSLALAVLAAVGADRCLGASAPPRAVAPHVLLLAAAAVSAVLAAVHLLAPAAAIDGWAQLAVRRYAEAGVTLEQFYDTAYPEEIDANRARLLSTFARAAAVALAASLLLLARRARPRATAWGLCALTVLELAWAGSGTVVAVDSTRISAPPPILAPAVAATADADAEGRPRPRFHRLEPTPLPLPGLLPPNLGAFYRLEDLAAYNPLPPRRLEELHLAIEPDRPDKPSVASAGAGVGALHDPATLRHPLLDLLGLRFVLSAAPLEPLPPGVVDRTPAEHRGRERLYERTTVLPRATFVTAVEIVPDRGERLRRLADPMRPAAQVVILEDEGAPRPAADDEPVVADIHVEHWGDEAIALEVACPGDGYLRIADPWHPGWTATVDGRAEPVRIADHYLRAVWVASGTHRVQLRFDGPGVVWPLRLGGLGLLAVLGLLALAWRRRRAGEVAA